VVGSGLAEKKSLIFARNATRQNGMMTDGI